MKCFKSLTLILLVFIFFSTNNYLSAQLKGSLSYEELDGFERSVSANPRVRIKSIYPNLKFDWSGGKPKIIKKDGDWIISLRPGLQTLYVSANNFESLDIKLDLRKYQVKTFRITPVIKQYFLKVETKPDSAQVILKETNGNKIIKGSSPFEYQPALGKYNIHISSIEHNSIDTTIVVENIPIIKLIFALEKKKTGIKTVVNSKIESETPAKIDSVATVTAGISPKKKKSNVKKIITMAGTATVSAWLAYEFIFKGKEEEKIQPEPQTLPGVPGFPK